MDISDLQLMNRLQNIFGAPQPTFNTAPIDVAPSVGMQPMQLPTPQWGFPNPQEAEEDWVTRRIAELYQPQNQMQSRLTGLLGQMPEMEKPSGWTRFGAALAGMGAENPLQAMQIGNQAAYAPYYRQMEQWKGQLDPTMKAAALEQDANQNARIMAEQTLQRELQRRRDIENERKNRETADINRYRAETGRYSAEIRDFKARNPNLEIVMPKGGFVTAINPQTGVGQLVRLPDGNPIDTGSFSDEERLEITQKNRLAAIGAQGAQTRENIKTREDLIRARPPGVGSTGNKELEIQRQRYNKAVELKNSDSELGKFIGLSPTGQRFEVMGVDPRNRRAPTQEQFNRIRQAIFGNTVPSAPTTKPNITVTRQMAIDALNKAKIPLTEENIKKAMDPANWKQ